MWLCNWHYIYWCGVDEADAISNQKDWLYFIVLEQFPIIYSIYYKQTSQIETR